jgi:hypothetical protein
MTAVTSWGASVLPGFILITVLLWKPGLQVKFSYFSAATPFRTILMSFDSNQTLMIITEFKL